MNSEGRPERVDALFQRLYDVSEEERRSALETTDPESRAEVEELLAVHDRLASEAPSFLSGLDPLETTALLEDEAMKGEGATIGRYRIVRTLGRGGMGIVLEAHDPDLNRPVALKLLPQFLSGDPDAIRRLREEARAASALDHPQIETVYEIGESTDGRVYIAMAHYEGETLRERIARGPMPVVEVLDLGAQLAAGLGAAHRAGIVHRDIKPENLLVTREGALKILDFGVAKLAQGDLVTSGLPRGTVAYMSPEQTRGEAVDARSDLWSAGVVLYEMLTGRRPFTAAGDSIVHAIRHDPHPPIAAAVPEVPVGLAEWIERCLEKRREDRPVSAEELQGGLRGVMDDASSRSSPRRVWSSPRFLGTTAVVALAIVALWAYLKGGPGDAPEIAVAGSPSAVEAAPAVAVLPFEVRGEELEIWREGMVDLLSVGLDGASDLRAIDSRTVLANWNAAGLAAERTDLAAALDVAERTGAQYAVVGSMITAGGGWRLGARVHRVEDGAPLASLQVDGPADSLLALADRLAIDILASIWHGEERPGREVDLARITTGSLPALKAYLEGESHLRRAEYERAIGAYERAVAADSTFAYALFHLGLAYSWHGDPDRMHEFYGRAARHAGRLPERESLLLRAANPPTHADLAASIELLETATRRYPDDADAWYSLGEQYWHSGEEALVGPEASEQAFRKVVELDPGFAPGYAHLVNNAFTLEPDSARAALLIEIQHRLSPDTWADQQNRIAFGLAFGDVEARRLAHAALDTFDSGNRHWLASAYLQHPSLLEIQAEVIERGLEATDLNSGLLVSQWFQAELSRGHLHSARAILDDPRIPPGARAAGIYRLGSGLYPVPQTVLDEALGVAAAAELSGRGQPTMMWFYAGAHAADRARWDDHARAVAGLEAHAGRLLAEGDSAESRFAAGTAEALSARALWARGDRARALSILAEVQGRGTSSISITAAAINGTLRGWIGELLLEMERPREALRYFESFWYDPWMAERLAPMYERRGDPARARAAWERVAVAWKDADPELQGRARAARAAVQRLDRAAE